MRFGTGVVGVAAVGALFASVGCGGPRYQYVQNNSLGVYAKLPASWKVYDEKDLFPDESQTARANRGKVSWTRTFDGSPRPSVNDSMQALGSDSPTGMVMIQALSPQTRDSINMTQLRGLAAANDPSADPVTLSQQDPHVAVMKDVPVTMKGGFHGDRTVFSVTDDKGVTSVVDTTGLLNTAGTVMYVFRVACTEKCYSETHKDEIAKVVDSWTIQEVR
jgi:hypothetical protein